MGEVCQKALTLLHLKNFLSKISLVLCLVAFSGCEQTEERPIEEKPAEFNDKTEEEISQFHFLGIPRSDVSVVASSELPYDSKNHLNYQAENILDMTPQTAWCAPEPKSTTTLTLSFDEKVDVGNVGIFPGYAREEKLFFENSRPKTVEVWYNELPEAVDELHFEDKYGVQFFDLNEVDIQKLTFKITEVYSGSKYQDLCISEVDFWRDWTEESLERQIEDRSDSSWWMQCEDGSDFNTEISRGWKLLEPAEVSTHGEHYKVDSHFDFWIPNEYMKEFNAFGWKEKPNEETQAIAFAEGTDPGCTALPFGDAVGISIAILSPEDLKSDLEYFEEYSIPKESIDLDGITATLYNEKWFGGSFLATYIFELNGKIYSAKLTYNDENNHNKTKFLEDVLSSLQSTASKEN